MGREREISNDFSKLLEMGDVCSVETGDDEQRIEIRTHQTDLNVVCVTMPVAGADEERKKSAENDRWFKHRARAHTSKIRNSNYH